MSDLLADMEAANEFLVEGDWSTEVTLIDPTGPTTHIVRGIVSRIGAAIDPGTGLRVMGAQTEITIRLSALGGALPAEGWAVETTDIAGGTIEGKIKQVMPDRTAGRVVFMVRA